LEQIPTIVPIFFVVSFVFSMLGMGGSQVYIPILFWSGMDFKTAAVPLGMLLNVANSSSATVTYTLKRLVEWRIAVPFAATMAAFAPLGVWLNVKLPVKPLLAFFAIFTASAALLMLSGWRPSGKRISKKRLLILGFTAGGALGIVAGLIGRGGGSFVVPILYILGVEPKRAAATSAFVVTCSGLSSFVFHLGTAAAPVWGVWVAATAAVLAGSQLGSRLMAGRMTSRATRVVFGVVLLVVAGIILVKDVLLT